MSIHQFQCDFPLRVAVSQQPDATESVVDYLADVQEVVDAIRSAIVLGAIALLTVATRGSESVICDARSTAFRACQAAADAFARAPARVRRWHEFSHLKDAHDRIVSCMPAISHPGSPAVTAVAVGEIDKAWTSLLSGSGNPTAAGLFSLGPCCAAALTHHSRGPSR